MPQERERASAVIETERLMLGKAWDRLATERKNANHLRLRASITDEELDELHADIERRKAAITERVAELVLSEPSDTEKAPDAALLS